MPYFPSISTLYIHIPKTGGTSIEKYFAQKEFHNICAKDHINNSKDFQDQWWIKRMQEDGKYLYSLQNFKCFCHSAQHMTLPEIRESMDISTVKRIIVSVRDPYARFLSDLTYVFQGRKFANIDEMVDEYEKQISSDGYNAFDNHARPQHHFIKGIVDCGVQYDIVRCEKLTHDMAELGYNDFDEKENCSHKDYTNLLSSELCDLVQKHYKRDFVQFGYKE